MGRLFDLIEAHREAQVYPPSYSRIAEQVGVSRQTLLNWKTPTKLIDKEHLTSIAQVTGVPYQRVLDALLEDIGYLHEENVRRPNAQGAGDRPTSMPPDALRTNLPGNEELRPAARPKVGKTEKRGVKNRQDVVETGSQDPGDSEPR